MRQLRVMCATLLLAVSTMVPGGLAAQVPPAAPPAPQAPEASEAPAPPVDPDDPFDDNFGRSGRAAVRIYGDYTLRAGDRIREVVVILGNATIEGEVDRHVVVIMGTAKLRSTARVGDNLVVVGGGASIDEGAVVDRDLVVVGGGLDAPAGFMPGGEHVVIGPPFLGAWFEGFAAWLTRGLLFGRVIVPDLGWVWGIVAIFFLIYLALNVLFERPVRNIAVTLTSRPLTAFGVGLLTLLLFGPVSMLLAVSVIGIPVVPFVVFALIAAWILGKVAVMRGIGMSVMPEESPDHRPHAVRSFLIGFALIAIAYMIPILGMVTWATVGVLGLGAATLSFISAYRRERPAPPPVPAGDIPPPPVPATYQYPQATQYSEAAAAEMPPAAAESVASEAPIPPPPPPPRAAAAVAPPSPSVLLSMPKALFRDRLAAFVLDVILVVIAAEVLDNIFIYDDGVFFLFLLLYHIAFWTMKQTTVGGIITQIRLVRTDGTPLTFADALVRGLSAIFSLAVLFIGALWILRDPESQAWHDKIAGTYVVKVPRNWPV